MVSSPVITIGGDEAGIPVSLVGKSYVVHPPKSITSLRIARAAKEAGAEEDEEKMLAAMETWIESAFTPADAKAVKARLNDPKDILDISHLAQLVQAVTEYATKPDPTSSASGSPRKRSSTGRRSTAGQSRKASR